MTCKPALLSAAILLALATPAFAQEAAPADAARTTLDDLIVTGTRVSDRTVAESTSPIDIITPEILQPPARWNSRRRCRAPCPR